MESTGRACNRRVAKLYLAPGSRYFVCRHCYDLTHRSCQKSGDEHDAAHKRTIKAARKLGFGYHNIPTYTHLIKRPKGMHDKTFRRLKNELFDCQVAEHEAAKAMWNRTLHQFDKMHAAALRRKGQS